MTGQLRSTLHDRAADLEIWDADLSSIVRDGNRRLRRRRTALVSGVAALALVAGGTALGLRDRHATAEPAPSDTTTKPITYAGWKRSPRLSAAAAAAKAAGLPDIS